MYISIMDYGTQSVTIIEDTDCVTRNLRYEDIELILHTLGLCTCDMCVMVSENDPYQPVEEYVKLRDLCIDIDDNTIERLQTQLNIKLK